MENSIIRLENISVELEQRKILKDITFSLPPGSFTAIIGPNGAGKTTLLKTILGLYRPIEGKVLIDGKNPHDLPGNFISYIPQFKSLNRSFPAFVWEVVYSGLRGSWPWRATKERVNMAVKALTKAGAAHLYNRQISVLSGGELQRVCLARSIIKEPSIIFLDEPATGIDIVGEADLYKLLEDYRKEREITIVMITHDWQVAKHHASHIIILNRGLTAFGTPDEVLNEQNLRKAFGHIGHEHPYQKERFLNV